MVDQLIVWAYFVTTLILGLYVGRNISSLRDFAIADKNYSDSIMVATLFATVIGGGSTLGVVTNVYQYGILFMLAFYGAALNKILVARYVAPRVRRYEDRISIGDIFEKNYGSIGRTLAGVCIASVSVTCIGQQITALGFVFEQFFHLPFLWGALIAYGIVTIYSAFGGIRAVVATDVYQFILIIAFVPLLFIVSVDHLGGFSQAFSSIPPEKLDLFSHTEILGKAITMFVVMTFSALDPSFIHRLIMAKNARQAAYITRVTGYLSLPLFTVMGLIGLIAFVINPDIPANLALPYLIDTVMPPVVKGITVAGLFAVLMSTVDSDLHVLGLSVVQDVVMPLRKTPFSDASQIKLARLVTFLMGIISVVVALYFRNIFDIMIFAFSFWGPTILVPFIFSLYGHIFTQRQLIKGVLIGLATVVLWLAFLKQYTGLDGFIPGVLANSLYFAACIAHKRKRLYA